MNLTIEINNLAQAIKHLNIAYAIAPDFMLWSLKSNLIQLQNELDMKLELLLAC